MSLDHAKTTGLIELKFSYNILCDLLVRAFWLNNILDDWLLDRLSTVVSELLIKKCSRWYVQFLPTLC